MPPSACTGPTLTLSFALASSRLRLSPRLSSLSISSSSLDRFNSSFDSPSLRLVSLMMLSYASALGFAFFHGGHSHGQTSTFATVFFFFFFLGGGGWGGFFCRWGGYGRCWGSGLIFWAAGGERSNEVVIGPMLNDGERTGADADIS